MFELSDQKKEVLRTSGNLLILGGPGSGKTTIALIKAQSIIKEKQIKKEQKILFLSFARATISRIEQQLSDLIEDSFADSIEITTYHSFFWTILKSHGYLVNKKPLKIILPHELAVSLSAISSKNGKSSEVRRLYDEEGLISFDLFASECADLLNRSKSLTTILSNAYPIIILDEFQDTDTDQWNLVKLFAKKSIIIVLADPNQRIYDFRGADPARIRQFIETCHPTQFDFGSENNRSNGTDIARFGNDLLVGINKEKQYKDVTIYKYKIKKNNIHYIDLKYLLIERVRFLKSKLGNGNWSIAVLLPSNRQMSNVSIILDTQQRMKSGLTCPVIPHNVSVDTAGPSIATFMIAKLLDEASRSICSVNSVIELVCEYILGHRGDRGTVTQSDRQLVDALRKYCLEDGDRRSIQGKNRKLLVCECESIANDCNNMELSGNVLEDWIAIKETLSGRSSDSLMNVRNDTKFIKLMYKGSALNSGLDKLWRQSRCYEGAEDLVRNALLQEHFETSQAKHSGIHVMTIYKAKGKEFDEVIVWDGFFEGERIVYDNNLDKARLSLRVAVTRAKSHTFIFTPQNNECPLL